MHTYVEQPIVATRILPTREHILALLRGVQDPHSGLDIVTLGWVEAVTVIHPQIIVTLHPFGRICATHYAIETAIERKLRSEMGPEQLRLRVRWGTGWRPDDE